MFATILRSSRVRGRILL